MVVNAVFPTLCNRLTSIYVVSERLSNAKRISVMSSCRLPTDQSTIYCTNSRLQTTPDSSFPDAPSNSILPAFPPSLPWIFLPILCCVPCLFVRSPLLALSHDCASPPVPSDDEAPTSSAFTKPSGCASVITFFCFRSHFVYLNLAIRRTYYLLFNRKNPRRSVGYILRPRPPGPQPPFL